MRIVIIEDEVLVAEELESNIRKLFEEEITVTRLESVKAGIAYFNKITHADLIFSDIQLGDGLSFEIFVAVQLTAPIIFCTAYDAYALEAFKTNGIDYILKPFTTQTLEKALTKYRQLKNVFSDVRLPQYETLMQLLTEKGNQQSASVLVYHQDKIIPVKLKDIALFYLENEVTHLLTFTGKIYYPNKNLDELEKLGGSDFFRANRQYLICRNAIVDVSSFFSRKLSLNLNIQLDEKIIVSKNKAPQFLNWLAKSL